MELHDIWSGLRTFADRSANIIGQSASIAALEVKKKEAEKQLWEAYAQMGKYAYDDLTTDVDHSAQMRAQMKEIDLVKQTLKDLNARIEEAKEIAGESDEEIRAERIAMQEKKKRARAAAEEVYRNELNNRS